MFGGPNSERILILAPSGRDAEIAARLLSEWGQASLICPDAQDLYEEIGKGAALALVAEEALSWSSLEQLSNWVASQPPWSDFPIIVLTGKNDTPGRARLAREFQEKLGNVSFLERPFHATTLVSVSHSALRSRKKQYQARDVLNRYELLARELQHRSKNLLTVVRSIAHATLADHPSRTDFVARLQAVAQAQDLIMEGDIRGASLKDVVELAVRGFGSRVALDGPHILLKPSVAQGFALILHELATNASKYGSLTSQTGSVKISWTLDAGSREPVIVFRWAERGGPKITPPDRNGFGSVLLEHAVANSGTRPVFDYSPEGFSYELKTIHFSESPPRPEAMDLHPSRT